MPATAKPAYRPPDAQLALFPEVSGNDINGHGETRPRRPSPVYWHYHDDLPHKALQDYYLRQFDDKTELQDFHLKYGGRGAKAPPAKPETPTQDSAENWTRRVKAHALANEADLVGIAAVDEEWVFEGYEVREPWVIVVGVAPGSTRPTSSTAWIWFMRLVTLPRGSMLCGGARRTPGVTSRTPSR